MLDSLLHELEGAKTLCKRVKPFLGLLLHRYGAIALGAGWTLPPLPVPRLRGSNAKPTGQLSELVRLQEAISKELVKLNSTQIAALYEALHGPECHVQGAEPHAPTQATPSKNHGPLETIIIMSDSDDEPPNTDTTTNAGTEAQATRVAHGSGPYAPLAHAPSAQLPRPNLKRVRGDAAKDFVILSDEETTTIMPDAPGQPGPSTAMNGGASPPALATGPGHAPGPGAEGSAAAAAPAPPSAPAPAVLLTRGALRDLHAQFVDCAAQLEALGYGLGR